MIRIATGKVMIPNTGATLIVGDRVGRKQLRLTGPLGGGTGEVNIGVDDTATAAVSYTPPAGRPELILDGVESAVYGIQNSSSPRSVSYLEIYDDGV